MAFATTTALLLALSMSTGAAGACADNASFVDEVAASPLTAFPIGRPPVAWGGTCGEWAPFDCGAASSTWDYTHEGQAEILYNCPAACGLCGVDSASNVSALQECPLPEPTPLFETFFDVHCLSSMPATVDIPCPLNTAINYFKKFSDEFRIESLGMNIVFLVVAITLTYSGGVPRLVEAGRSAYVASYVILVVLLVQSFTLLLAGIMVIWSYIVNRQLFGPCMVTLDLAATSPNFLDLVVVPTWFLMPSMACLASTMWLYLTTAVSMLEEGYLGHDSCGRVFILLMGLLFNRFAHSAGPYCRAVVGEPSLGASWVPFWSLLGPLLGLLGVSWGLLATSWGLLEASWGLFGTS